MSFSFGDVNEVHPFHGRRVFRHSRDVAMEVSLSCIVDVAYWMCRMPLCRFIERKFFV